MVNLAEDNSSALIGTAITFLTLTYVSVSLRTYVRARLTRNFQVDDGLMLVAQVGSLRIRTIVRDMLTSGKDFLHPVLHLHLPRSQGRTRKT